MYVNDVDFRAIERIKDVYHTTLSDFEYETTIYLQVVVKLNINSSSETVDDAINVCA